MSSLTREWFRKKENKIEYKIEIQDFLKKIKTFRTGRSIHSRYFWIGESKFIIEVYPKGNSNKNKDSVSVYLSNIGEWGVKIHCQLSAGQVSRRGENVLNYHNRCGFPNFVSHDRCRNGDVLEDDGSFLLHYELTLLEEEVTQDRGLDMDSAKVSRLKTELESLTDEVRNLSIQLKKSEEKTAKKIKSLQNTILNMNTAPQSKPCPECPICYNEMKPPSRIYSCRNGHHVCEECNAQPQVTECPTCREPFVGRATGMEEFLRQLFNIS